MSGLVLSLFPGMDVLGLGFEQEGFCVVQGPDILFGRDVRDFQPPAGKFDGVIGGPPCPAHSRLRHQIEANSYKPAEDLVSEFERVTWEAYPRWFVMENAPACREPRICDYIVHSQVFDHHSLNEPQGRKRLICFGTRRGLRLKIQTPALISAKRVPAVTADPRPVPVAIGGSGKRKPGADLPKRTLEDCLELQGLPRDFLDDAPFTMQGKRKLVGNAVPLPMARAIARAVKEALAS